MSYTQVSITRQMIQSSDETLLCNVKDSTSNKLHASEHSQQNITPILVKNVGSVAITHLNPTKESVTTSSRDVPKHKQAVTVTSHYKRNSWLSNLSNLSSKFTSTSLHLQSSNSTTNTSLNVTGNTESPTSLGHINFKYAILAQAQKPVGDEPYVPALPRTSHSSFLQNAFRRLSSSRNLITQGQVKAHPINGLCERKILNVNKNRRRYEIEGLNPAKLRRVSFCVDIQVMEGLKYHEVGKQEEVSEKKKEKEEGSIIFDQSEFKNEAMKISEEKTPTDKTILGNECHVSANKNSKKKEKKKRNEIERKAKKEKKKKLAEAHGRMPLEVTINHSVASLRTSASSLKQEKYTTLDPLRIYKRCCLLRETSVLKRIAEQLADPTNYSRSSGVINRLDLTGHYLETSDTITLSDFLALVPVNDLVMENCGLTDECTRTILAGLLSTRHPESNCNYSNTLKTNGTSQGGFVTRVVLKNNPRIGRDGWQYICTFVALCRSLKSIDLSQIKLPQESHDSINSNPSEPYQDLKMIEVSRMLGNALSGRPESCEFKLLNMADCGLSSDQIKDLVDGFIKTRLCRLGLAENNIQPEGLQHIGHYIRNSNCEGLDLSGNDLRDHLGLIANSLTQKSSLHSLSLAKSNLSPDSISSLFPVLVNLKNFKFINLSNNPQLFCTEPNAIPLFRRYLPRMRALKKINLMSVSLNSDQAIALAEILPELPSLAHLNIMENPLQDVLKAPGSKCKNKEEEACALYTSLMAAVRVSKTLVCVDIEVPSPEASEVVKALAKQVVAYCLWNMEHAPMTETNGSYCMTGEKNVDVPDILLHLLGNQDEEPPRSLEITDSIVTDEDYVISGTGVVRALSICLSNIGDESRQDSISDANLLDTSGTLKVDQAREMSKNLLNTARNIRSRLQLTVKESRDEDAASYQRLISLDQTLEGLIKRFEDEFPEIRHLPKRISSQSLHSDLSSIAFLRPDSQNFSGQSACSETSLSDDETCLVRPVISRQTSDLLVAGRALGEEEGRMLRLSQKLKRNDEKTNNGYDEDEKPVLDWMAPLDKCAHIFEGGFTFKEDILSQPTISANAEG
ncbi:putative cell wall biogenesis protein mhp1 [Erysiphe neolycopersici]|uniref:Putative cell wall biogenesis protein mhp1 n=1 Tax=Erysiphe neolycopersici TaxID=212602 RepID=A0A420H784_9PEZI|nr:putative cell wall biogenesis protein mhp1 [Erysiphe neolycopersici]